MKFFTGFGRRLDDETARGWERADKAPRRL